MTSQHATVLCAGEALIDLVATPQGHYAPCLGGAVYNLARAIAKQGVSTAYLNPLSGDGFGQDLRHALTTDNVKTLEAHSVDNPTSLAIARTDKAGKAHYSFYREGVADRQTSAARLNALSDAAQPRLVASGCLAFAPEDQAIYLPWLAQQRQQGRLVATDLNIRAKAMRNPEAYFHNAVAATHLADLIKASDEDVIAIAPLFGWKGDPAAQARQFLAASNAHALVFTLGEKGALLLHRDGLTLWADPPSSLKVVDTIGAGDCFFGGFLGYLLRQGDTTLPPASSALWQGALQHAIAAASINVERQGCQPPSWQETRSRTGS